MRTTSQSNSELRQTRPSLVLSIWALSICLAITLGCDSRFSPSRPVAFDSGPSTVGQGGVGVSSQVVIESPLFGGLRSLVSGDGRLHLQWDAAEDDVTPSEQIRYRVYVATDRRSQDFGQPELETGPGVTQAELFGLTNGTSLFVVVRAVDTDDREDDNTIEWPGTPNPVRYVDSSSSGGDGSSPASAFESIGQAVGATIGLAGVNLYVRSGAYGENVFLFPGMALYGGFEATFDVTLRDPSAQVTDLSSSLDVDLVIFQPGILPIVLDGFVLSGNNNNATGIVIEDVPFSVANCEVRDMQIHGIEIRSDLLEADSVSGTLRRLSINGIAGEGVFIEAIGEIVIDDCVVRDNRNEGIESQWLIAAEGQTTRLDLTRNRIFNNGEEGVDLDFAEIGEVATGLSSQGGRIRFLARANEFRGNGLSGLQVDIDYRNEDGIDGRFRIEDNQFSANLGEGILIDGDAAASIRLARNVVTANHLDGIFLSGIPDGPWVTILNSRIVGNGGAGIATTDSVSGELRHSWIGTNFGGSVTGDRCRLDASQCAFSRNAGGPPEAASVRYSIFEIDSAPSSSGTGIVLGPVGFERMPAQATRVVTLGTLDEAIVANVLGLQTGDVVEFGDDGVVRRLTSVGTDRIQFDPPTTAPWPVGTILLGFGAPASGAEASVQESESILLGSPAIDGGDPEEMDRDGSVADVGPVGGDTPGNIGIETGLGVEELPAEIEQIRPQPGLLVDLPQWTVRLRRPAWPSFSSGLSLRRNGLLAPFTISPGVSPREFTVASGGAASPGDHFSLEFAPQFGPDPLDRFTRRVQIDSIVAPIVVDADGGLEVNGSIATAQSTMVPSIVRGTIATSTDQDFYRFDLLAGDRLRIDVIAGRRRSTLVASATLWGTSGSALQTSAASPPLLVDPILSDFTAPETGTYFMSIQSAVPTLGLEPDYEVQLRLLNP